jgi:hypothetical protein
MSIIPGHPNLAQLGFVNPFIFITVEQSQPETVFHPSRDATVGRTNGSAELITYVTFNVPDIRIFPGANANTKGFVIPLPTSVNQSGSKTVEIFDLQPGVTLPTSMTFDDRLEPNNNLSTVTFGGPNGLTPVEMDSFVQATPNFGGTQSFEIRATGDNAAITFSVNPVDIQPNGVVFVIANVS